MKLKVRFITLALLAAGCSEGTTAEDAATDLTVTAAEVVADAQDTEIPLAEALREASSIRPHSWRGEASQCDTTPETTVGTVCGQEFPASEQFAWSDCAVTKGRGGPGKPPGKGGEARGDRGEKGPKEASAVTSSGSLNVTTTEEPIGECGDSPRLRIQRDSVHALQHTRADGTTTVHSGTVSTVTEGARGDDLRSRTSTFDTTRTRTDAEGTVVDSHHVTGSLQVAFDGTGETDTHTSQGTLTLTQEDGASTTVTLTGVVRVPPSTCAWPVAGSIQREGTDGTHVLSFGPACGEATLDGAAVTLPERPSHPRGGKGSPPKAKR